jgi:hypothetical protein
MKTCKGIITPRLARSDGHTEVDDRCWHFCGKDGAYERTGSVFADNCLCQRCYDLRGVEQKKEWVKIAEVL